MTDSAHPHIFGGPSLGRLLDSAKARSRMQLHSFPIMIKSCMPVATCAIWRPGVTRYGHWHKRQKLQFLASGCGIVDIGARGRPETVRWNSAR
jgi:hypothetical protein